MNSKKKLISLTIAAAAISLATLPLMSTTASAKSNTVKCYGVNSCKGHSKCKTAQNACKGHNSCKGQGFIKVSAKKCAKLKGTTEEPKADAAAATDAPATDAPAAEAPAATDAAAPAAQ